MKELFAKVLSTSLSASWLVLLVLVVRWLLRKAPRGIAVLLWGFVAVRLLCPVMLESPTSLLPRNNISEAIVSSWMDGSPEKVRLPQDNREAYRQATDHEHAPILAGEKDDTQVPNLDGIRAPTDRENTQLPILPLIWVCGIACFVLYTIVSYFCLCRKTATAIRLEKQVYQSNAIQSPFVMGLIQPRIYLPIGLHSQDIGYVIAHEKAHISCGDHWWKPLGLALLTVHWFNPFMWIAYILLCRDIELACDEKVIRTMKNEQRAAYSQALVSCSLRSYKVVTACPLAFGEIGVKERIRAILYYRKPTVGVLCVSFAAVLAIAACFLTRPPVSREFPMSGRNISDLDTELILTKIREVEQLPPDTPIYADIDAFRAMFDAQLNWRRDSALRFVYPKHGEGMRTAQLQIHADEGTCFITKSSEWEQSEHLYSLKSYLDALKYLPLEELRNLSPDADVYAVEDWRMLTPAAEERTVYYNAMGVCSEQEAAIHLLILPLRASPNGDYQGSGEEGIRLLYTTEPDSRPREVVKSETDLPLLDTTEAQLQAAQTLYESWQWNELIPAENIAVGNMNTHSTNTVYMDGKAYHPVMDARYSSFLDIRQALHRGFTDQGLCALGLDKAEAYYREQNGTLYRLIAEVPPVQHNWEGPVLGIVEEKDTRLTLRFAVSIYANENQILPETTAIDLIFVQQNGNWKLDGQAFYTGALPTVDTSTETVEPQDREELLAQALAKDNSADYAEQLVTTQVDLAADYPAFSAGSGLSQLTLPLPQGWSAKRADKPIQSSNILEHYIPEFSDTAYYLYDVQGTRRGMISLADNQTEETAEFACYYGNNLHFGDDNPHVHGKYPENVTVHTAVVEHSTNVDGIGFQDGIWMQYGDILLMMEVDLNTLSDAMLGEVAETLAGSLTN